MAVRVDVWSLRRSPIPIWAFNLPDDTQPNPILGLSALNVVTTPKTGNAIAVETGKSLNLLLDVTADRAKVSIHQIALVGCGRFAGIWPWGPQISRVRVTAPHSTHLDTYLDAGSINAEHSWKHVRIWISAGSVRLGDYMGAQVCADAGSIVTDALYEESMRTQISSVHIRSVFGVASAHTETSSVRAVKTRGGTLDLSSEMEVVLVGVSEGIAVLADCHSDFGRAATNLPRQEHSDAFERRLELWAHAWTGTVRVRRA